MALTKIKLGKYIELFSQKCNIPNLTNDQVSGVNKEKEFFEPSTQVGGDTSKYKLVPPNYFACNLMHVGRDVVLPIAYNHSGKNKIVSPAYFVFKFIENDELLSDYFFIFLKSAERDRYFWFHTDTSVRDGMSWEDFTDVEIELPSIEIQRKYVKIYKGMVDNQASYEAGLEDLKTTFISMAERLKKEYPLISFMDYVVERSEINKNLQYSELVGVGNSGFIVPRGSRDSTTFNKCNIFYPKDFVYNPSVIMKGAIAYNNVFDRPMICTEEYIVFYVSNEEMLLPEYLFIWLRREETGRYLEFYNIDSVRNRVYFDDLDIIRIPIPPIDVQRNIAYIFKAYTIRREINEHLKQQIKNICPVLIKGAVEEAKQS